MLLSIAQFIESVAWIAIGAFGLFFVPILLVWIIGGPGYLLDKLIHSPFGKDIFLPIKIIFRKFRGSRSSSLSNIRQ